MERNGFVDSSAQKSGQRGRFPRSVTVHDEVFAALREGRRKYVIKGYDEWNERKFLRSPLTHLYVNRHTDRGGITLLFGVVKAERISMQTRSGWQDYIRIELTDKMEIIQGGNRK